MYSTRPGLILGFHGCDKSVLSATISGTNSLRPSTNSYDWLGHGIYFWDHSPSRAFEFARTRQKRLETSSKSISSPAVIGAVLNLGFCFDLLDYINLLTLKQGYELLNALLFSTGSMLPTNSPGGKESEDFLLRELDCAVIETIHKIRRQQGLKPYDSIRSVFWEGKELYPTAGFREKNHIQICVRNPNCIKGYFRELKEDENWDKV